ncbi:hypothetical protein RchiOBHm_Chr2g0145621 [Rosa chinensis]|uniref:Uncharacterized protein n=1 Tax=Rosa chinensis TaxID=74649 RepID=A0A2P6RYN3_ROSCH|nr:hypothetical protein RchiOBHm_Chr2g0145621 [Rosa chinensis]
MITSKFPKSIPKYNQTYTNCNCSIRLVIPMKYDQGSREMLVERGSLKYPDLNYFPRHHTSFGYTT